MESGKVIPVRVAVRSRPLVSKELIEGCQTCTRTIPGQQCIVLGGDKTFTFDYVFGEQSSQLEVYEACISDLFPKYSKISRAMESGKVIPVRVAVRSRPLVSKELIEGCQTCTRTIPGQQCIVLGGDKTFTFDYVFGEQSSELEVAMESGKVIPVLVAVRSRPLVSKELIEGCQTCTRTIPGQQCIVLGGDKTFTYDYVFGEQSSQLEVYEACISDLLPKVFKVILQSSTDHSFACHARLLQAQADRVELDARLHELKSALKEHYDDIAKLQHKSLDVDPG
ncbi:hypothetical protein MRX96_006947 [Rhipicephalus microplus]